MKYLNIFSKMLQKTSFLIFWLFFSSQSVVQITCENYCYMKNDKPYRNFAHLTAYEHMLKANMSVPSDCDINYIFALIRHGTPYVGAYWLPNVTVIKDHILENHNIYNRGQLCNEDFQALANWTNKWTGYQPDSLLPQGKADMRHIANRLRKQSGTFFDIFEGKFTFVSTHYARCQESAVIFTNELLETSFKDLIGNNISINDALLQFGSSMISPLVLVPKEVEEFQKSKIVSEMISNVSKRLGFESDLSFAEIRVLYFECGMENARSVNSKPAFCVAFTNEHLKILEYWHDLLLYYQVGYGNNTVGTLACPIIKNLLVKLMAAAKDPLSSEKGTFYFTHVETLLPLITQMELFYDEIPLRHDNFESQNERKWRIADVNPYAANLMVILFKCKGELKIVFYNNEKMIKFHDCEDGICSVDKFEEIFTKKILKKCSQNISSRIGAHKLITIIVCFGMILFSMKDTVELN